MSTSFWLLPYLHKKISPQFSKLLTTLTTTMMLGVFLLLSAFSLSACQSLPEGAEPARLQVDRLLIARNNGEPYFIITYNIEHQSATDLPLQAVHADVFIANEMVASVDYDFTKAPISVPNFTKGSYYIIVPVNLGGKATRDSLNNSSLVVLQGSCAVTLTFTPDPKLKRFNPSNSYSGFISGASAADVSNIPISSPVGLIKEEPQQQVPASSSTSAYSKNQAQGISSATPELASVATPVAAPVAAPVATAVDVSAATPVDVSAATGVDVSSATPVDVSAATAVDVSVDVPAANSQTVPAVNHQGAEPDTAAAAPAKVVSAASVDRAPINAVPASAASVDTTAPINDALPTAPTNDSVEQAPANETISNVVGDVIIDN